MTLLAQLMFQPSVTHSNLASSNLQLLTWTDQFSMLFQR